MPIPANKYYCKFRCGRNANTLKSTIDHEKACFADPKTKACRTCEFCSSENLEDATYIYCEKLLVYMNTRTKEVFDTHSDLVIFPIEQGKFKPDFESLSSRFLNLDWESVKQVRPFPNANCELYKEGERVY